MTTIAAAVRRTLFLVKLRESFRVRNAQMSQHTVTSTELSEGLYLCTTEKNSVCL